MEASQNRVLIVGATSRIAEEAARIFASRGCRLFLVARDNQRVEAIAADLRVRGATLVGCEVLDVNNFEAHESVLNRADRTLGGIDTVLIAHGSLSNQLECEASVEVMVNELRTNGLSVAALASRVATRMADRRRGTLVVISSVAGDRGRQSNYVYGSAKALVTAFMSGLRQRMYKHGVHVVTVKPGFVDTPMTAAMRKGYLWVKPDVVAKGIVDAIDRKRDVVYLPFFWRPIMHVVKILPERLFKRLTM